MVGEGRLCKAAHELITDRMATTGSHFMLQGFEAVFNLIVSSIIKANERGLSHEVYNFIFFGSFVMSVLQCPCVNGATHHNKKQKMMMT